MHLTRETAAERETPALWPILEWPPSAVVQANQARATL